MTRIAVFGLGEAGSLIAADLVAAGAEVQGYDPAPVDTPPGVARHEEPVGAVEQTDLVLGLTAAADAERALRQALDTIPGSAIYADLSTSAPGQQRDLAQIALGRGLSFVDVALMATVLGNGLRTPQLASGPGSRRYAELLTPLGAPIEIVGEHPGEAATRKLLRSIWMKGLAALGIEAIRAAGAVELDGWMWRHLAAELEAADGELLTRLITNTPTHAVRRRDEMQAAASLLDEFGIEAHMTRATVASLEHAASHGVPLPPDRSPT